MTTKPKQPPFRTSLDFVRAADAPQPVAPVAPVAPVERPEPEAAAPAEPKPQRMPWDGLDPKAHTQHLVRLGQVEKAQLVYLVDHTPRASVNSLIREAIQEFIDRRLKELKKRDA